MAQPKRVGNKDGRGKWKIFGIKAATSKKRHKAGAGVYNFMTVCQLSFLMFLRIPANTTPNYYTIISFMLQHTYDDGVPDKIASHLTCHLYPLSAQIYT